MEILRYNSEGEDHSQLKEIVKSLVKHKPEEEKPIPVTMLHTERNTELPPAQELQKEKDPEIIRKVLNAYAAEILEPNPETKKIDYAVYEYFCEEYDELMYRAWYVTTTPPRNTLFGYTLEEEVADGAFGRVFKAKDNEGRTVAVKILREEVRRKPEMLQSFRRGVRSMRILADRKVQGMVPYEEASEIPAVAAMEFIEGPNLQQAVDSNLLQEWNSVLDVSVQLASIIRRAHLLPERVLHRDIRPPNIMLRDYYSDPDVLNVVVLDFDLSWHIGAQETSIVHQATLGGFLAPEQVLVKTGMSTRSAAVDSFGMGMTLFFLRTKREPQYLQHLHSTWKSDLYELVNRFHCAEWESLPVRFARLVLNATKNKQRDRWDMGQIEGELQRLYDAFLNPEEVQSSELITEELAQRTVIKGGFPRYEWDPDHYVAKLDLPSGIVLSLKADESLSRIRAEVLWSNLGGVDSKNIKKYLKPAMDQSISTMRSHGWHLLPETHLRISEAGFSLEVESRRVASNLPEQAKVIDAMLRRFQF